VDAVFGLIAEDPRHHTIMVVARRPIGKPAFPRWPTGFRSASAHLADWVPGAPGAWKGRAAASGASLAHGALCIVRETVQRTWQRLDVVPADVPARHRPC